MADESKQPKKEQAPVGRDNGNLGLECADLLGRALDSLIARARAEEPFSPDLAGGVEPTLQALNRVKETYLNTVREEVARSGREARAAIEDQVRSTGAIELLQAAIAVGQVPTEAESLTARGITLANGARRIPWLEIIKEVADLVFDILPGVPPLLKRIIREILKIIDKIFGGMPHEEHAQPVAHF